MKRFAAPGVLLLGLAMSVTACSDPYDPGQRAVGGGLLGAGAGAAIGGLAGGGRGALAGGLIGGAVGAAGGAATTPDRPPPPRYEQSRDQRYEQPRYQQAGLRPAATALSAAINSAPAWSHSAGQTAPVGQQPPIR